MNQKILMFIIGACVFMAMVSCVNLTSNGEELNQKNDMPIVKIEEDLSSFYKVYLNLNVCNFVVKINDVVIQKSTKNEISANVEIPITEWLLTGKNEISIEATPVNLELKKQASVEIACFNGYSRAASKKKYFSFKEDFSEKEEIKETFTIEITDEVFQKSLLADLPVIDYENEEVIASLYDKSIEIHNLFRDEKKAEILALFNKRQVDFGNCYKEEAEVYIKNLETSIDFVFGNPDFTILPFKRDMLIPKIAFNGKLATLGFTNFNNPFINFYKKDDTSLMHSFPLYFALDEKGEWFICR